jgi:hypothetical protein
MTDKVRILAAWVIAWLMTFILVWAFIGYVKLDWYIGNWDSDARAMNVVFSFLLIFFLWVNSREE